MDLCRTTPLIDPQVPPPVGVVMVVDAPPGGVVVHDGVLRAEGLVDPGGVGGGHLPNGS